MINKIVLTFAGLIAVSQAASDFAYIGNYVSDFNLGVCLGFQNDITDTSTTCYASCETAGTYMAAVFDSTQYTNGQYNSAELIDMAQTAQIYLLTEFKDCHLIEFLYALDNRFSDSAFTAGMFSNIGTQVATTAGYYVGWTQTTGSIQTTLWDLFINSALYMVYADLSTAYTSLDFESMGLTLTLFVLSIVNYAAPNVNTGRSTM